MNYNLKNSYEVNYLHRIYSKLTWLVFSFTITTLIGILFVKQASFNFTFIAVDAIMLICLAIAYTLHMFLMTRKSVHYNQYTAFVSSIEISPIKNIRCNIYFDDCNGNRIYTKTHYVFYSWQLVDLENSVNNTVTLPILYNSATGQVIVLTNPSK